MLGINVQGRWRPLATGRPLKTPHATPVMQAGQGSVPVSQQLAGVNRGQLDEPVRLRHAVDEGRLDAQQQEGLVGEGRERRTVVEEMRAPTPQRREAHAVRSVCGRVWVQQIAWRRRKKCCPPEIDSCREAHRPTPEHLRLHAIRRPPCAENGARLAPRRRRPTSCKMLHEAAPASAQQQATTIIWKLSASNIEIASIHGQVATGC